MSPLPFSDKLTRSFGALLALLLFLVGFSLFNFHRLSQANRLNVHTYQVITATFELQATLYAIESGARGYIVTGEPGALQSYRAHLRIYDARFRALRFLTGDNPTQQQNLAALDARQRRWTGGLLEVLIANVRRQLKTDSSQVFLVASRSTGKRRVAIKELQDDIDRIVAVEAKLLVERGEMQARVKAWTQWTLLLGGAFSIVLTAFLVLFASRSARQLGQSSALLGEAKIRAEEANTHLLQVNVQLQSEIAARRASDERLRRNLLELRRSNAELEQFAYVASHDLQEPLRAVAGCVGVLQRRYAGHLDARADQFIQHAINGAQRMQTLIHDLLAYSRLGSNTRRFQSVAGAAIVQAALQNLSVAASESGAQITVDELPVLICDGGQIEQVLQNLLSNALKFHGEAPPRIHIGYATKQENGAEFHVLSVEDDGLGIEPQYFERIFVMFQRLHTRAAYAGTGIGLAICKKIIERHGGKIWVENSPHQAQNGEKHGSKFAFSLPFEPENEEEILAAENSTSDAATASEDASLTV